MRRETPSQKELRGLIARELVNQSTSWMVGEFGALGEFHHTGEAAVASGLTLRAPQASLRIRLRGSLPIAYEAISGRVRQWLHGVAICLLDKHAEMSRRTAVTDLGLDRRAVDAENRGARLFDLGLGLTSVDFCVRTSEAPLIEALLAGCGKPLIENEDLFDELRRSSPQRVLLSRLARLEIFSAIPPVHGPLTAGPHTHLLPGLLRPGRVYSANLPIPGGWTPCLYMFPAHPLQDQHGNEQVFQEAAHARFQQLLHRYGTAPQLAAKTAWRQSLDGVQTLQWPSNRHARHALRVAMRQEAAIAALAARPSHEVPRQLWVEIRGSAVGGKQ